LFIITSMIDRAEIQIKAGAGGDGVVSFRREKFVPFGGPDGGDGGRGGSVYIVVDNAVNTLQKFRYRRHFRARDGGHGSGKDKHGRNGVDILIRVPKGTVVHRREGQDKVFLGDLTRDGEQLLVARGGVGGYGNAHFASSTNQAPHIAQKGEPGEECALILDLKLIAEVGIIGCPNVGKSTLLAHASAARPEIAEYPFTTREPVLGVVEVGWKTFVMAEIPGLIEGAHQGRGLGHEFLRHAERTKLFIHLLDGGSLSPLEDFRIVNGELALHDSTLSQKPQVVVVNKLDLPQVKSRLPSLEKELSVLNLPLFFISAVTGEGTVTLMREVARILDTMPESQEVEASQKVFRPVPRYTEPVISREGDVFLVSAPDLEKLAARISLDSAEGRQYLKKQFGRMGVTRALKKAGIRSGDRVRVGEAEMEWSQR
jgi:GTP-binding protein